MSTTARDRRRAAAFVLASAALLALVLALLGGRRLAERRVSYVVVFRESVSGLEASSAVEYKGVPIGTVREIRLRPGSLDEIEVEVGVRADVPLRADVQAQLRPQGITGLYLLELSGGTTGAPALEPGGVIEARASILSTLEAALRDVAEMARDLKGSGDQVGAAVADLRETLTAGRDAARALEATAASIGTDITSGVADLRETLAAGRDAARALEATAASIGTDVTSGVASLRATSDDVRAVVSDPAWRALGGKLADAVDRLGRAADSLDAAAAGVARVAEDNHEDVRGLVQDLRRAGADVRAVTRRLRESPTSLVVEHPAIDKPIPDPEADR